MDRNEAIDFLNTALCRIGLAKYHVQTEDTSDCPLTVEDMTAKLDEAYTLTQQVMQSLARV